MNLSQEEKKWELWTLDQMFRTAEPLEWEVTRHHNPKELKTPSTKAQDYRNLNDRQHKQMQSGAQTLI